MTKLERTIKKIGPLDAESMRLARARQDRLTKPKGSLGRLEELSIRLAGIQGTFKPVAGNKVIVTMAADHGVVREGVTLYPQEVTAQMVANFLKGGAGINVLARQVGARVVVVDMGVAAALPQTRDTGQEARLIVKKVGAGTRNMARGPAMSPGEALRTLEAGIEVVEDEPAGKVDILGTGDMGIGNTTASSAIAAVMTGSEVSAVTGRGTGLDDEGVRHKIEVIERALEVNRPDPGNPLDVLARVGGFEIGGLAGVILAAASRRIPVVIDGFISGAAALIAFGLEPKVRDYLIASHRSVEIGHARILAHLGLRPLLDLDLRLGEGTGAALGISLLEASAGILNEMATFDQAGVSGAES